MTSATELVSRREATTLLEEFLCGYQNILLSRGINANEAVRKQNELIDEYAERIFELVSVLVTKMDWLLPCPFCGGEAKTKEAKQDIDGRWHAASCGCPNCGVFFWGDDLYGHNGFANREDYDKSLRQSVAAWNTRWGPARDKVVRCKDCKHYHPYTRECDRFGDLQHGGCYASVEPDGFCAWPERRDSDARP